MRNRPYRGLRAQRRRRRIRMVISLFLVVVLLLMLAYWLLQDYIVFSDGEVRVQLPWSQQQTQQQAQPPTDEEEPPLVIEGEEENNDSPAQSESELSQRTVAADTARLGEESYRQQLLALYEAGAIDSVMVTLKDEDGVLTYPSSIPAVQGTSALSSDAQQVGEGLAALREAGVELVGVIWACTDNQMPMIDRSTSVHVEEGVNWLDRNSNRHLDPTSSSAIAYLNAIVEEAAQLGVGEIVLADWSFPTQGQLDLCVYAQNDADRTQALANGLAQFQQTAQQNGAVLSIWAETPDAEESETSGLSLGALATYLERQYLTGALESDPVLPQRQITEQVPAGSESFVVRRESGEYTLSEFGA